MDALTELEKFSGQDLSLEEKLELDILKGKLAIELGEIEEAKKTVDNVVMLCKAKDKKVHLLKAYTLQIGLEILQGNFDMAYLLIDTFEKEYEKLLDRQKNQLAEEIGFLHYEKGILHSRKGELESAVKEFEHYYGVCKQLNLRRNLGLTAYQLGTTYRLLGKMDLAIEYLTQALHIFEQLDYYEGMAGVYSSLEEIHQHKGDQDMAFIYVQKKKELDDRVRLKNELIRSAKIISRLNREIEELNRERIQLEQKIFSLEFELNSTTQGWTERGENKETRLKELEEKLAVKESEIENLVQQLNAVDRTNEIEILETKLKEKEEEIHHLKENLVQLERKLEEAEKERSTYKAQLKEKEREIEEYRQKFDKIEMEHKKDIDELILGQREELSYFENKLEKQRQQLLEKEKQIEELQKQLQEHQNQVKSLKHEMERMKQLSSREDLAQKLDAVNKLKEKIKRLEERRETLEKRVESKDLMLKNQEGRIETLTSIIRDLEKERDQAVLSLGEALDRIEALKLQIVELERKNMELGEIISESREGREKEKTVHKIKPRPIQQLSSPVAVKLASSVEEILETENEIKLRTLAMSAGVAPYKALEAISELEKAGIVKVEYSGVDDLNPTIKKL